MTEEEKKRENSSEEPEGRYRLLAVVKRESVLPAEREPEDTVFTFPYLLIKEAVAALVVIAVVIIISIFLNAPLREMANPNLTPNPAKAPWYFLALQELLHYFHPLVSGILFPAAIIITLIALPYIDRNPSTRASDRKVAIILFTIFLIIFVAFMIIGMFFRGPGWQWVWPWREGLYLEL